MKVCVLITYSLNDSIIVIVFLKLGLWLVFNICSVSPTLRSEILYIRDLFWYYLWASYFSNPNLQGDWRISRSERANKNRNWNLAPFLFVQNVPYLNIFYKIMLKLFFDLFKPFEYIFIQVIYLSLFTNAKLTKFLQKKSRNIKVISIPWEISYENICNNACVKKMFFMLKKLLLTNRKQGAFT